MARVTAEQYAEKWGRRLKGAGTDITNGINNVTVSPGSKAAKKSDKMLAGVNAAVTSGLWAKRVSAVSLEDWKKSAINKGLQRIAAGVDGAQASQVTMAQKLLAAVDQAVAKIDTMPDNGIEDSIARAAEFMRTMSKANIRG